MKYVRYQSQGSTVGIEAGVDDYWEIADDGYVVRSIHLQPDGSRLKYDLQHEADGLGALPEGMITDEMLADKTLGQFTFLTATQFDGSGRYKARMTTWPTGKPFKSKSPGTVLPGLFCCRESHFKP